MPRQNRVTPFGNLIATPARGTLMGNRGCLHDASGRIVRNHKAKSLSVNSIMPFRAARDAAREWRDGDEKASSEEASGILGCDR